MLAYWWKSSILKKTNRNDLVPLHNPLTLPVPSHGKIAQEFSINIFSMCSSSTCFSIHSNLVPTSLNSTESLLLRPPTAFMVLSQSLSYSASNHPWTQLTTPSFLRGSPPPISATVSWLSNYLSAQYFLVSFVGFSCTKSLDTTILPNSDLLANFPDLLFSLGSLSQVISSVPWLEIQSMCRQRPNFHSIHTSSVSPQTPTFQRSTLTSLLPCLKGTVNLTCPKLNSIFSPSSLGLPQPSSSQYMAPSSLQWLKPETSESFLCPVSLFPSPPPLTSQ